MNAMNFRELAKKATSLSELMSNRTRLTTEEMIERFPAGFTIADFDMLDDSGKQYPVFTVKEDDTVCFFGGVILARMVDEWLGYYDSVEECREAFRAGGGVMIKMSTGKTKKGNNITKVDVL